MVEPDRIWAVNSEATGRRWMAEDASPWIKNNGREFIALTPALSELIEAAKRAKPVENGFIHGADFFGRHP